MWWTAYGPRLRDPLTGTTPVGEVTAAGWTTVAMVEAELGAPPLTLGDYEHLSLAVDAANATIARLRSDLPVPASDDPNWDRQGVDPSIALGATTLAQRWFVRRTGAEAIFSGEFGSVALPAIDLDLQQLLGIGRHFGPRVG